MTVEVFGSCALRASSRDILAESLYPQDSRILFVPLNEDQHNCWLKFLELAYPRFHLTNFESHGLICCESGKVLLELNHPFVPAVVDFAVDAFNELCMMYFKKGVEDNIYEAEVTNVKYSPNCYGYTFFIRLEALEEDAVGVYEATVICDYADGRRTLLKFIRSLCPPVGGKFNGIADLIHKKSRHDDVKVQKMALKTEQKIRRNAMKGRKRSKESAELNSLKEDYKTVKGACHMRDKYAHQINWKIKRSNPDDWFIPNKITGLQRRSAEHPCGGYDYRSPLKVFMWYLMRLAASPARSC